MTNLRDQRQATLGASYSIDRELGGVGALEVVRASSASLRAVLARTYGCTDTTPGQSADRTIVRSSCPPGGELVGCESASERVDDSVGRAPRSRAGRALRTSARARRWRDGHGLPAEGVAYRLAAALDSVVP